MILDYRLDRILKEVQEDLKKDGIELTVPVIEDIIDSQFKCVRAGIEQLDTIVLPYFGTFGIKKRTQFVYDQLKELKIDNKLTRKVDCVIRKVNFNDIQSRERPSST